MRASVCRSVGWGIGVLGGSLVLNKAPLLEGGPPATVYSCVRSLWMAHSPVEAAPILGVIGWGVTMSLEVLEGGNHPTDRLARPSLRHFKADILLGTLGKGMKGLGMGKGTPLNYLVPDPRTVGAGRNRFLSN